MTYRNYLDALRHCVREGLPPSLCIRREGYSRWLIVHL